MQFIDLKTQYELHKVEINQAIQTVLDHGQFIMGPEVAELERTLSDYVGVKHCLTVSSGTHSLEIALRALGVGPGDEVITVPFSWISSAEIILLVGATPVFVDIDPQNYTMDPHQLAAAITKKTKAIIPVSLFGQMPDLESIQAIADMHGGIPVIEDAAQSFGATRNGKRSCGSSLIGSTSFFPAKPFGCYGDGGALFTDDDRLAATMKAIRTHGGEVRHHHTHVGTNGRFDTLQAAIMLAKWPHFESEVESRKVIGARYSQLLKDICEVPSILAGNTHVYAQYTIRVDANRRPDIQNSMKEAGIPTGVYYPKCLHEQPVFADLGYKWGDFPNSELASREVMSLPMHPYLDTEAIEKIRESLLSSIR
ncbi:MAG: DegT/DnrJ/EryC1/StrS family aminotransferase [Algoriphagus sp.]|nr:DegT/DnrJ/EryC1/StrS family aminotransferase [Algoriphagus sp.]